MSAHLQEWARSCLSKRSYPSQVHADNVPARVKRDRDVNLRSYYCPHCARWHLAKAAEPTPAALSSGLCEGHRRYRTVQAAQAAAEYVQRHYGRGRSRYHCAKCGDWHLSGRPQQDQAA